MFAGLDRERQGELLIFFELFIWGFFPIMTVLSYRAMPPMVSLGWSTIFAALFFGLSISTRRTWQGIRGAMADKDVLWATFFNGILFYVFFFWGLKFTSAGNASIVALTEIFFTALFFNLWRREYLSAAHLFGAGLMLLGALIVLYPNRTSPHAGDIMILIAAMIAPFGNFFAQKARKKVSSETIMFVRSMIAGPAILFFAYMLGDHILLPPTGRPLILLILNGLVILGFSKILWLEATHRIIVIKAQALSGFSPLLTLFFAWLFLRQNPTFWQISAFLPMIIGVALLSMRRKKNEDFPISA